MKAPRPPSAHNAPHHKSHPNETGVAYHARPLPAKAGVLTSVDQRAHYARLPLDKHAGTAPTRAQPPKDTPVTNSGQREHYTGAELAPYRGRPAPWMPTTCPVACKTPCTGATAAPPRTPPAARYQPNPLPPPRQPPHNPNPRPARAKAKAPEHGQHQ